MACFGSVRFRRYVRRKHISKGHQLPHIISYVIPIGLYIGYICMTYLYIYYAVYRVAVYVCYIYATYMYTAGYRHLNMDSYIFPVADRFIAAMRITL